MHMQSVHSSTLRGSPMQLAARQAFHENMEKKLAKKPWILEKRASLLPSPPFSHFSLPPPLTRSHIHMRIVGTTGLETLVLPDFPVACRRLTPGPGYLEALCEDNVSSACKASERG